MRRTFSQICVSHVLCLIVSDFHLFFLVLSLVSLVLLVQCWKPCHCIMEALLPDIGKADCTDRWNPYRIESALIRQPLFLFHSPYSSGVHIVQYADCTDTFNPCRTESGLIRYILMSWVWGSCEINFKAPPGPKWKGAIIITCRPN